LRWRLWPAPEDADGLESAVTAAGLEDFRFHDCRQHFASWFMMRGGSLQALKELLGHRDIRLLIYVHLTPAHLRAEVAKTERPAAAATGKAIPSAVSTKSAQSSSATVESEERVR